MTDFNKFNPYPDILTIKCPSCSGPAEFRFPFSLLHMRDITSLRFKLWPTSEITRWGGWYVVQHDPELFRWKPPRYYENCRSTQGIRWCNHCVGRAKHTLVWPSDAFFAFELREGVLWAWTEEHAKVLADYIGSKDRKPENYAGYYLFLHHIPSVYLDHRARKRVSTLIRKRINELSRMSNSK